MRSDKKHRSFLDKVFSKRVQLFFLKGLKGLKDFSSFVSICLSALGHWLGLTHTITSKELAAQQARKKRTLRNLGQNGTRLDETQAGDLVETQSNGTVIKYKLSDAAHQESDYPFRIVVYPPNGLEKSTAICRDIKDGRLIVDSAFYTTPTRKGLAANSVEARIAKLKSQIMAARIKAQGATDHPAAVEMQSVSTTNHDRRSAADAGVNNGVVVVSSTARRDSGAGVGIMSQSLASQ